MMTSLDSRQQCLESVPSRSPRRRTGFSGFFAMGAGERERDAVRERVPRGRDDARDRAVVFLMAAAVGGSGAVFLAFTLPSLVTTGGRVFFCVS